MEIVIFKNFTKRKNSTKRPDMNSGTHKDVKLKGATSLRNPSFIMSDLNWTTDTIDYIWWNNRYYFVDDITYINNNEYVLSCSVDVLATFKDYITNYNCFIERSATKSTVYLDDPLTSVVNNIYARNRAETHTHDLMPNPPSSCFHFNGCYLVRVMAPPPTSLSSIGVQTGIISYAVEFTEMYKLLNYAFDQNNFQDVFVDATIKAVFNPLDYLIDVTWVPLKATELSGNSTADYISLGWWQTSAQGYAVNTLQGSTAIGFTINKPTFAYGDYRLKSARFTTAELRLPGIGWINVDPRELTRTMSVTFRFDRITGQASAYLNFGDISYVYAPQLTCKVALSQTAIDMQGMTTDVISATENFVAGNITSGTASLVDYVKSFTHPTTKTIGSQGNISAIQDILNIVMVCTFYESCNQPNTCGMPYYKNDTIGNFNGFVKCGNASCPIPGLDADKDEVNAYLNGGFYYE